MPWEKSFDIDEAVDRATEVFWAKGYEATSLADILEATGINRGSFYNAFGSKKKIFTQGLLKYDLEQRKQILIQLAEMNDPVLAISTLFEALIEQSVNDSDQKGCLLVNTALDLPNQDDDIEQTVKSGLNEFEEFFKQQIELGHKQATINKTVDPKLTAKALLTLVVGLRVLARGVYGKDSLESIKQQAIKLVK